MYTLNTIGVGLAALLVLVILARLIWGARAASKVALVFVLVWFVIAAVTISLNLYWYGYSLYQEGPMFALSFGAPFIVALILWRWFAPK